MKTIDIPQHAQKRNINAKRKLEECYLVEETHNPS